MDKCCLSVVYDRVNCVSLYGNGGPLGGCKERPGTNLLSQRITKENENGVKTIALLTLLLFWELND